MGFYFRILEASSRESPRKVALKGLFSLTTTTNIPKDP